jgi:hypothetical protein
MRGKQEEHRNIIGLKIYMKTSPPNIERVFGYDKYRRWVAFFWSKQEDACLSFDGYAYTPVSALAWDSFFGHQLTVALNHTRDEAGLKKLYEFGGMHVSACHWMVLDRQYSTLFVGEKNIVLDFFHDLIRKIPEDNDAIAGQPIWMADNEFSGGGSTGRLEMINNMIQWMDHRLKALKEAGTWPTMVE